MLYCGEYADRESGLIYLRNRYYDPTQGRFITEDPIRDGTNWYVYCENNPVMYTDPLGLKRTKELISTGGGSYTDVVMIQVRLTVLGYTDENGNKLTFDGQFGTHTKAAVKKFQRAQGLDVDGIVGDMTWEALGFDLDVDTSSWIQESNLPLTGEPNSTATKYGNDGEVVQKRTYGSDGKAREDEDFTDHGNSKKHPKVPHKHKWGWDGDKPMRGAAYEMTPEELSRFAFELNVAVTGSLFRAFIPIPIG